MHDHAVRRSARRAARANRRTAAGLALAVGIALGGSAQAGDSNEFWPELSAFVGLSPGTRLYLDASYARGKESNAHTLDLTGALDISLMPIVRQELATLDWQRSRYLWARVGYTRVAKIELGNRDVTEDRGTLALSARAPLPQDTWLELRTRADLRWISGSYSTRYRLRLEVSRDFEWQGHAFAPYANAEAFYDMRYDGLSRNLYQAGVEFTVNPRLRLEAYLARQLTRLPEPSGLTALGLVGKLYY